MRNLERVLQVVKVTARRIHLLINNEFMNESYL